MTQRAFEQRTADSRATAESGASALRPKLRKHFAAALVVAVFSAVSDTLANFHAWLGPPLNRALALESLGFDLVIYLSFVLSLFVAALAAERATARGASYGVAWGTAVLGGCAFATALQWVVLDRVFDWSVFVPGQVLPTELNWMMARDLAEWTRQQAVWVFLTWSIPATLAMLLYARWRRAVDVRDRLHAAEVRRSDLERQMLEARLQATRARVEPRFLFDTLARVRALHPSDPHLATAELDSLIDYLRAVLPHLRDA